MEFSRGRRGARGKVHVAGEVAVEGVFVLAVVVRCVRRVDGEVALWQRKDLRSSYQLIAAFVASIQMFRSRNVQ